jgi:autotransporter translocation and assembly factor TamB
MRRRTKGLVYLLVILCLLVLGTLIVFRTQGERIAIKLGDFLTSRVGRDRHLSIEIGDISGSMVRDLRFKDVLVSYTGGETPVILLSASSIYAEYNLPALLLGRIEIDSMSIQSPNLIVPRRADGSMILLSGDAPPGKSGGSGKRYAIRIDRFAVDGASVNWQGAKPHRISRLDATGSIASLDGGYRAVVDKAGFQYGRSLTVSELEGSVDIADDGVRVEDFSVATPASRLAVSGFVRGKDKDSLNITVVVDSLSLAEVPAFSGGDLKPGLGTLTGRVRVGGSFKHPTVDAELGGNVLGWPLKDLTAELAYGDGTVDLDRLSMLFNGVAVDLSCQYDMTTPPRYRGVVAFRDLDLARFAGGANAALETDLTGSVRFAGRGTAADAFSLDAWPRLDAGRYRDWRFGWVRGKVRVSTSEVVLDTVRAGISETEVMAAGHIGYKGRSDLEFVYDVPGLAGLSAYHGLEELEGRIRGKAHLSTATDSLALDAHASGGGFVFRGTKVESLVVDVDLSKSGAHLSGEGHLLGLDLDLMGVKGRELIGDVTLADRTVDIRRFALTRPDGSLVGLVGAMDVEEGGFELVLSNLFVEMGGFMWENGNDITVSYKGDSLVVADLTLQSRMGTVEVKKATYDRSAFTVAAALDDINLGLLRNVTGREMPSGTLNASLGASGRTDSLAFNLDFSVADGDVQSVAFQALTGRIKYDASRVDIVEIALKQNGGSVTVEGWMPVDLSPTRIQKVVKAGSPYDLLDDLGKISVRVSDMDLAMIEPLMPATAKFKGIADLSIEIGGNKRSPAIASTGSLHQAFLGGNEIGAIRWDIALEDSVLRVHELAFGQGEESGRVQGYVPAAVSVFPFSGRIRHEAWELDISVENGNLGPLCELVPKLKVCSGTYHVDLKVGGTVQDPSFYGSVKLVGARLRVEGVAQDVRDLYLDLTADGKRFEITNLEAEGGALKAQGFFQIAGLSVSDWNLRVSLDHYRVTEFEDFYAQLKGNIVIKSTSVAPGLSVPLISGDITVEEGEYYFAATGQGGGGEIIPATPTPAWLLDVTVDIPNDFWIRGDMVNAEIQGDVNVRRGKEGLLVLGTLQTIRGNFNVYHNSFSISKGEFRFNDVKSFWNAYIDLEANTTVLDERIQITATGPIDQLDIRATSESGWTEQQIFEALLLRRGVASTEGEQGGFLSRAFVRSWANALVGRFGDKVARELHLDRFGVEIGPSTEAGTLASTRVMVGKYVYESLYLEYSQTLGTLYGDRRKFTQTGLSYPERQLSVEYRFSENLSIEGETGTLGGLPYFDLDLKLHYGY